MNLITMIMGTIAFIAFALLIRAIVFFLQLWSYKKIQQQFFDGKPKAWYPPEKKPTFFKIKN